MGLFDRVVENLNASSDFHRRGGLADPSADCQRFDSIACSPAALYTVNKNLVRRGYVDVAAATGACPA